jgi:hypothetical protein
VSDKSDCSHPSHGECLCGEVVAVDCVALWDAINEYVVACGGNPSKNINVRRMNAVVRVENVIASRGVVTTELGRWVRPVTARPMSKP